MIEVRVGDYVDENDLGWLQMIARNLSDSGDEDGADFIADLQIRLRDLINADMGE